MAARHGPAMVPRLFVEPPLAAGARVALPAAAANYLGTVLRLGAGAPLLLLDDTTGEWAATLSAIGRRGAEALVGARLRPRETPPDLWLCAALLKSPRFEMVAEKATELGVARLVPLLTRRTVPDRLNAARLRARMVEAAEQCGRTALPELAGAVALERLLADWPAERALILADEAGGAPIAALSAPAPAAILIGPEGGWDPDERALLLAHPATRRLALGPRILRADTAALAAISLWMATAGDWAASR
jgi:16S rRNA (uracil1498-N3)-methyltransferase